MLAVRVGGGSAVGTLGGDGDWSPREYESCGICQCEKGDCASVHGGMTEKSRARTELVGGMAGYRTADERRKKGSSAGSAGNMGGDLRRAYVLWAMASGAAAEGARAERRALRRWSWPWAASDGRQTQTPSNLDLFPHSSDALTSRIPGSPPLPLLQLSPASPCSPCPLRLPPAVPRLPERPRVVVCRPPDSIARVSLSTILPLPPGSRLRADRLIAASHSHGQHPLALLAHHVLCRRTLLPAAAAPEPAMVTAVSFPPPSPSPEPVHLPVTLFTRVLAQRAVLSVILPPSVLPAVRSVHHV